MRKPKAAKAPVAKPVDIDQTHAEVAHHHHEGGHGTTQSYLLGFVLSVPLVIDEEEEPVFDDRPSEGRTKIVTQEFRRLVRLSALKFRELHEIIIRAG